MAAKKPSNQKGKPGGNPSAIPGRQALSSQTILRDHNAKPAGQRALVQRKVVAGPAGNKPNVRNKLKNKPGGTLGLPKTRPGGPGGQMSGTGYSTTTATGWQYEMSTESEYYANGGAPGTYGQYRADKYAAHGMVDPSYTYGPGGTQAAGNVLGQPGTFATGVSAATLEFIKEFGQSQLPAAPSTAGAAGMTKRGKKQRKKLVKRVVKKTNVKGKAVRKALRSPGVTAKDKKVYQKVAKQATPKLSSRLRAADRRKGK